MGKLRRVFRSKWLKRSFAVILTVIVLGGVAFGSFLLGQSSVVLPEPPEPKTIVVTPEEVKGFAPLVEVWTYLQERYYGELPPLEKFITEAVRGGIKALDPGLGQFTYYHDPAEAKRAEAEFQGKYAGIGVHLTEDNGQLVIAYVIPGGPADKADPRLKPGDTILTVDGKDVAGLSWEERHQIFRGEPGTTAKVRVRRVVQEGSQWKNAEIDVEIIREEISTPAIRTAEVIAGGKIGYIHLTFFTATSANEMRDALMQLKQQGVEALILDLRGNPGGYRNAALLITSQFLEGGIPIIKVFSKGGSQVLHTYAGGLALDIPLVILIDEGSASASEFTAGVLKQQGRAVIIGSRTAGKGVGQTTQPLSNGGGFAVVDHEFRIYDGTPEGIVVQGIGIEPDIPVSSNPIQRMRGLDSALERAVQELSNQIGK